jgi:spermidine synthase
VLTRWTAAASCPRWGSSCSSRGRAPSAPRSRPPGSSPRTFGASTLIWANTIGVVLVALSLGYWYGGRYADRNPSIDGLARLVLIGAALLALLPFIADPFLELAVGGAGPISVGRVRRLAHRGARPRRRAGVRPRHGRAVRGAPVDRAPGPDGRDRGAPVRDLSTVGSLTGTYASALLLIPLIGVRRTFLVFALLLATTGVLALTRRRAYVLAPAAVALLLVIPVGTVKQTDDGSAVIHETDTEYQYARVVEETDGDRFLELNEGQAVHSIRRTGSYLTDNIWDEYLVAPFTVLDRPPERIAILGNAAGTTARAYGRFFPDTKIDGVEIDGELTEIGREFFDLRNPNMTTHAQDARPFLRQTDERYDAILVDAYRQPYIPFYLATREFFQLVRERLRPGGLVMVNAGHPEGNDDLEKVLSRTMTEAFATVVRDPAEDVNTLLIGTNAPGGATASGCGP